MKGPVAMAITGFRLRQWQGFLALAALLLLSLKILLPSDDKRPPRTLKTRPLKTIPEDGVTGAEDVPFLEPGHPIDGLIAQATISFREVMKKESHNVRDAAAAYRRRRNRHPPPGFDKWFEYAQENDAVIVEDFFDQIYHDLGPFWGYPAQELRESVAGQQFVIGVRNGKLDKDEDPRYRMTLWHDMLKKIAKHLPDVDLPFNQMDETRLLVPWETIAEYMVNGRDKARLSADINIMSVDEALESGSVKTSHIVDSYPTRDPMVIKDYDFNWTSHIPPWTLYREVCHPMMPVHYLDPITDFAPPSVFIDDYPFASLAGYVKNASFSRDVCLHPEMRGIHASFIEPLSNSFSTKLFPIFGGSRLYGANDILVPAPRYWSDEPKFAGTSSGLFGGWSEADGWNDKYDEVFWRGVASGGRNRPETWTHFQRHRFLSMLNGTQIAAALRNESTLQNIIFPLEKGQGDVAALVAGELPEWVDSLADARFTDLLCLEAKQNPHCDYTEPWYELGQNIEMHEMFKYKYLPDIDGNSFSGRYRAFLMSSSLPIKATIYSEWHDSRLFEWKHYVPMDNTFYDLYGIMDYFVGFVDKNGVARKRGHSRWARTIALEGQEWARKVLRKEDMLIYMYRLVLEFARLAEDDRANMGYVKDLHDQLYS